MKALLRLVTAFSLLLVLAPLNAAAGPGITATTAPPASAGSVLFIENVGQFADGARFRVWGGDGLAWLSADALWVTVAEQPAAYALDTSALTGEPAAAPGPAAQPLRTVNLRLSYVGANPHPRLEPFNRSETKVSYFYGSDPAGWHADVPVWSGVRYVDLYPGIDLELSSTGSRLTQRLVVRGGASLARVQLKVEGAESLEMVEGRLIAKTALGDVALPLAEVVGMSTAAQPSITGSTVATPFTANNQAEDARIQDNPAALAYATYLGSSGYDYGFGIDTDSAGNAYVTGQVGSREFTGSSGPATTLPCSAGGNCECFILKLNPTGSALAYAAFLGGSEDEWGYSIQVNALGEAFVAGKSVSRDFPTTPGAYNRTHTDDYSDVFVAKLNAAGTALVYSTFIGESNFTPVALAIDGSGQAYVTAQTNRSSFPTTPGAFSTTLNGDYDAFVTKLNADGSALVYSTLLGGAMGDNPGGIAVDSAGQAYIAGATFSANFPTTAGAYDRTFNGPSDGVDGFVTKLNAAGSALVFSTLLGGSGNDGAGGIAVDPGGQVVAVGSTQSSDFPTTAGVYDSSYNGGADNFVVKLNNTGTGLIFATYLGGNGDENANSVVLGSTGQVYLSGFTKSANYPVTPDAFNLTLSGNPNACISKLNATGTTLVYSSFINNASFSYRSSLSGVDQVYITGSTYSANLATPYAVDTSFNGIQDAYALRLDLGAPALPGAFSKSVPADGDAAVLFPPLALGWQTSAGAFRYEYCIDDSNNDTCNTAWVNVNFATAAGLTGKNHDTTYYWQVRAVNNHGTTYANGGAWWSFTTGGEPILTFVPFTGK
ncbi:MAG: DUF7948 domain-containing protein [Anaerolineae bacterium]